MDNTNESDSPRGDNGIEPNAENPVQPSTIDVTLPVTGNSGVSNGTRSSDIRARRLANLKPFKKGQSGNPSGRPKGIFRRRTMKHLRTAIAEGTDQLDAVVDAQIQQAIEKRDTSAATFLRDTVDGKPQASSDNDRAIGGLSVNIECIGVVNVKTE